MTEPYLTIAKNTTYEQTIKNLFALLLVSPQKKKLNNLSPASKQLTKKLLIIASHI